MKVMELYIPEVEDLEMVGLYVAENLEVIGLCSMEEHEKIQTVFKGGKTR